MNQLGYYGKTPHRGDFVRFNLPQSFINVWDDWLQQVLIHGEQQHEDWANVYLNAPTYRFSLSSGIAGNEVWIGVVSPSQDKVGRRFPFCMALSLDEQALACVNAASHTEYFEDMEALMQRVLSSHYDFDQLQLDMAKLAEKHIDAVSASACLNDSVSPTTESAISVSLDSSEALMSPIALGAILDAILSQTLNGYSVWMGCPPASITLVNNGLPTGRSALSLFNSDWDKGSAVSIASSSLPGAVGNLGASLINDAVANKNQSEQTSSGNGAAASSSANSNPLASESQAEDDSDAALDTEQTPSPDDWAALEDFAESDTTPDEPLVPDVEPLELDEDVTDAPWEQ